MKNKTKKILRILSRKYYHEMIYEKGVLIFKNILNHIEVGKEKRGEYRITYNLASDNEDITVNEDLIIDVLISLFERMEFSIIEKREPLITLEKLFQEEQYEKVWKEHLKKAWLEDQREGVIHKNIGGNRILVEYYSGLLILMDDLCCFASNAILYEDIGIK